MVTSFSLGGVKWRLKGGDRFWGVCPGRLLRAFIESYRSDGGRGFHNGQYFSQQEVLEPKRWEPGNLYHSPYHKDGQYKVRLVQQYLWFPYRVDDPDSAVGGKLFKAWTAGGMEIGDLYYFSEESKCANWFTKKSDTKGQFVKDEEMSQRIQQLLEPRESVLVIKLEHWKMDERPQMVEGVTEP
jgi:hypothetical protein